jgi:hypothetical protein
VSRTVIVFIVFGVLAVIGIVGMLFQRARAAAALRRERRTPVPLVIPVTRGVAPPTPWRPPPTPADGAAVVQQPVPAYAQGGNGARAAANGSGSPYAPPAANLAHMETPDTAVRRQPPPASLEGTLQLLPGRFEVVAGMDGGRDIRFVRGPGGTPEVTLGRMEGPTYRHVQLPAQTVSRMHARMRFEGGRWQLSNLSPTNPVLINGEPLEADGQTRTLSEGDRVELGEVVLRFRERA